jgi:hypothetical protein
MEEGASALDPRRGGVVHRFIDPETEEGRS